MLIYCNFGVPGEMTERFSQLHNQTANRRSKRRKNNLLDAIPSPQFYTNHIMTIFSASGWRQ